MIQSLLKKAFLYFVIDRINTQESLRNLTLKEKKFKQETSRNLINTFQNKLHYLSSWRSLALTKRVLKKLMWAFVNLVFTKIIYKTI